MQPTLVKTQLYDSDPQSAASSEHPLVGLLRGGKPQFDDETTGLLRSRLFGASIAIGIILGLAFIGNFVVGKHVLWWLRALFLATMLSATFLLRRPNWTLVQLRIWELVIFGIFFVQLLMMMVTRLVGYAEAGDIGSFAGVEFGYLAAFCVLILAYGIFVPNDWRRGSLVIIPLAIAPYVTFWILAALNEQAAELFQGIAYRSPIPITGMGAAVGIYGTHTINSVRQQAFEARQFGQYQLGKLLGSGGMGQVFEAEHLMLKRPCAIKLIHPENAAQDRALASFEKEVKATARLTHWNTVEIFDYGHTDDGTFYYVMELLKGLSLQQLVNRFGPLPPARWVHLWRQLCDALEEAHAIGLIHRDLKPGNIQVSQLGTKYDVAKLLDFGLVKETDLQANADQPTTFSGTPLYMSPEQALHFDRVDGRSDIYSLGCVAYFALTGRPPFQGSDVLETLKAHALEMVPPVTQLNPTVPADLEAIVLKCLAKDPFDRYQNVTELGRALDGCRPEPDWSNEIAGAWWAGIQNLIPSDDEDDEISPDDPTRQLPG